MHMSGFFNFTKVGTEESKDTVDKDYCLFCRDYVSEATKYVKGVARSNTHIAALSLVFVIRSIRLGVPVDCAALYRQENTDPISLLKRY